MKPMQRPETSMSVESTVDVLHDKRSRTPRVEWILRS